MALNEARVHHPSLYQRAHVDGAAQMAQIAPAHPAQALAAGRYARLQAAMAAARVDGALLSRPAHGFLVSGARRVQVAGSGGGAPWVVAVLGAPAPHVFTPDPDGVPAWIPRPHVHPLLWDPEALVRQIVALVRPGARLIAYDILSVAMIERVGRALPDARLEDAAPLLAAIRVPKTRAEIDLLAAVAAKAERAVSAAGAALAPGTTRREIAAAAFRQMAADGISFPLADGTFAVLDPAKGSLVEPPDSRRFERGDHVLVDLAIGDGGTAGRCVRTFICGRAADAAEEALAARWRDAVRGLADAARAGAPVDDLRAAGEDCRLVPAGLLAHGIGIGIEPPFIDLGVSGWHTHTASVAAMAPGELEDPASESGAGANRGMRGRARTDAPTHVRMARGALTLRSGTVLVLAPCVFDGRAGGFWASEIVVVRAGSARRLGPACTGWTAG